MCVVGGVGGVGVLTGGRCVVGWGQEGGGGGLSWGGGVGWEWVGAVGGVGVVSGCLAQTPNTTLGHL